MSKEFEPGYLRLKETGELEKRAEKALKVLESCVLCGRQCRVNRVENLRQAPCRTGRNALVASFGPHHGEEAPISGSRGSGTIFFTHCNMKCVYCQNYDISHLGEGSEYPAEALSEIMLRLQDIGCHNINLVSSTHIVPHFLEALVLAAGKGLEIPIVYNTGGYDSLQALELLKGIVDIYMPDMKYSDERVAFELSGVSNYPETNREAVKEMWNQVGDLEVDDNGVAGRGLLVRHLVLPNGLAGSRAILEFIAKHVSRNTSVNIMGQYRPVFKADEFEKINRYPFTCELKEAVETAASLGLRVL